VQITGVIVLPGLEVPNAARSPFIMRPYDAELLTCKRYYCKTLAGLRAYASAAGGFYENAVLWPVEMRAAPTASCPTGGGSNINATYPQILSPTTQGARFALVAGAAAGDMYALNVTCTADARP
jgi:hypothetical protein